MKYLNFEGLQYFYSKLSSSLASQYVSQGNLKTINGQSLIGTGDITIEGGASGDYLPLSGGTMTGNIVRKDDQNRTIYNIGTVANGPWIQCFDRRNGRNITINGSEIKVFGGGGTATIPNNIRYAWDNIHFSLWPDNQTNRIYKFNLQKLIDDGYLIEE